MNNFIKKIRKTKNNEDEMTGNVSTEKINDELECSTNTNKSSIPIDDFSQSTTKEDIKSLIQNNTTPTVVVDNTPTVVVNNTPTVVVNNTPTAVVDNTPTAVVNTRRTSINTGEKDGSNSSFISVNSSMFEIRTSQSCKFQGSSSFKYNFNLLEQHSKNYENLNKINQIKNFEGFKCEIVCALVKSITKFRDTYKLELIDETGTIIGHSDIEDINIGDLLILKNCGIWKLNENQLNIINENVVKILKQ